MKILICNAGSTSLKFKLYDMPAETVLASGGVERVGSTDDAIYKYDNASRGVSLREEKQSVPDYETGIRRFLADVTDGERGAIGAVDEIERVGFKTVLSRGYYGVHELTEPVLQGMRDMYAAAPAHNGPYLAAIEALRNGFDFLYIHVEAPDECGHHGEAKEKIWSIEQIDEKIILPVLEYLRESGEAFSALCMPDHPTPLAKLTHTPTPVPYALYRSDVNAGNDHRFTEAEAEKTGVFTKEACMLMPRLLEE